MATYTSGKLLTSATPAVYANYYYESARSGTTMKFRLRVGMYITSSGGWRNNRWACCMSVNGTQVAYNFTVKAQTSGKIGTGEYLSGWSDWYSYEDLRVSGTTSASVTIYDTGYSTGWTCHQNWGTYNMNLPIIGLDTPSPVSVGNFNIGSGTTISINKSASSFTHTITFNYGGWTGTLATKTSASSIPWTPDAATLYSKIPNAKSGVGTIYCDTYAGNTHIGTTSATFTCYAVEANCKPTLSPSAYDTNSTTTALTGNNAKLIKGYSNVYVAVGASARCSASIKSYKITTGDGRSSTASSATFNNIASGSFTVTATDSRGYTTSQTFSRTLLDYIPASLSEKKFHRASSTSSLTYMTLKGVYFNSSFGSVKNTLTLRYRYKVKGAASYSSFINITDYTLDGNTIKLNAKSLGSICSPDYNYQFEINIADKLTNLYYTVTLLKAEPIIDIGPTDIIINAPVYYDSVSVDNELATKKFVLENGGGGVQPGTTDYLELQNLPQINSHVLEGNLSASDLGLATAGHTHSAATTSASGLMTAAMVTKLNGIAAGATKNTVTNSLTSTSTTNALSAYQGKVLNDKITTANTNISNLDKELDTKITAVDVKKIVKVTTVPESFEQGVLYIVV